MTRDPLWSPILAGWGLAALVLLIAFWSAIRGMEYPDPDDILRLLEVRDLIGGQSWWDVSQHRLASGAMHWSRLVDLPIAAVELVVGPFAGAAMAERVALVTVPLFTLLAVMALVAFLTRRLLDSARARYALLLVPLSVPLVYQLRPMRIDHHGWQIVLALAALLAFTHPRADLRSGAIGGAALAALLTISLEGLPIAAALLGLVALGWAIDPARRDQWLGATWACFGLAAALHLATRGPAFWTPACDAMAPVWLAILGVAAGGSLAVVALGRAPLAPRLAALAVLGLACVATVYALDPRCAKGPFGTLDPIVRALWYESVSEGLPIWQQTPSTAIMNVGLPIVGLYGSWRALRAADGSARAAWWMVLAALVAAFGLSLLVARAGATANAFAVPGGAMVVAALLARARRIVHVVPRIAGTLGALLVAAPGIAAIPVLGLPRMDFDAAVAARFARSHAVPCRSTEDVQALRALPAATLFAPIDIAPEIIGTTPHRAIASGHHRNMDAMRDVLKAFIGTPDAARATVAHYHADYVVGCPGFPETELYQHVAPNGFWARLERGERFAWLRPVRVANSRALAWRVVRPLPDSPAHP